METDLSLGNKALKEKKYAHALKHYHAAMAKQPELASIFKSNIKLAEKKLGSGAGVKADHLSEGVCTATIDIVVTIYNALEDVQSCLKSLASNTDGFKVKVIVVNDGSDKPTTNWLREFCSSDTLFQLIEHPVNRGYTCAVNTGLRSSSADFVITQNSDTIVTPGWLQGMVRCMNSDPNIGVVGPLSNAASWQNVPVLRDESGGFAVNSLPDGQTIESMGRLVASASSRKYPRLPFVNGFCFMIRRSVIEKVGYMDEENFPIGYGEENDFCIRVADAGFELAIADDVYVFHAKSKSFGHEKRTLLSQQGTDNLKRKHTPEKYTERVAIIKRTEALDAIRAQISAELKRQRGQNNVDLMTMKILFLLPVKGGGGGAHSVVQEVTEMRRLGINAKVGVKKKDIEIFFKAYEDIEGSRETFLSFDEHNLVDICEPYDIIVGTVYTSMRLVKQLTDVYPHILPAYYVQDYEPMFFSTGSPEWKEAKDSYTLVHGAFLFAKTQWIIQQVEREHGVKVHKVQPSIDHQVYKPVQRSVTKQIHLCAMIRPKTPRRGAERTMRLLAGLHKKLGNRIAIHLFGCESDDPEFQKLERGFPFTNHAKLLRPKVAALLAQSDLFIDLSDYQAFGRTALEAMACGCTAVVPAFGGAHEYATHKENALVLDTNDEMLCSDEIAALLENHDALQRMRRNGLLTASRYSVRSAAISEGVPLENALKTWRRTNPFCEKQVLFLIPNLRSDGLPTDAGYIRAVLPYKSTAVLRDWRVHQISDLPQPGSGQVVLIQRDATDHNLEALQTWVISWKAAGGKLLYEIDENLFDVDGFWTRQYEGDVEATVAKVRFLAVNADVVHVSTESLADRVKTFNYQVTVIPTTLDADLWQLSKPRNHDQGPFRRLPNGPVRIGYIGTRTDFDQLEIVTEAMRTIEAKYGNAVEIEVIGAFQDRKPTFGKRVGLPKKNDYPNYVRWLQERVHWDIGILPFNANKLKDSDINFKFKIYALLDMAIVMSDAMAFTSTERHLENCLIVNASVNEWVQALSKLIDEYEYIRKYSSAARFNTLENILVNKSAYLIKMSLDKMTCSILSNK